VFYLELFRALPAIAKLRWLDEARRFTLLARKARVVEEQQPDAAPAAIKQAD
jgi:hypothetical protein